MYRNVTRNSIMMTRENLSRVTKNQLNWHQTESTARYNVTRKPLLGHKNVTMTVAMGLGDMLEQ